MRCLVLIIVVFCLIFVIQCGMFLSRRVVQILTGIGGQNEIPSSSSFRSCASSSWSSSWFSIANWDKDVMLCKSPFMIGPLPCACGRCMPCRVNKKRMWVLRMLLEARKHKHSSVATLTYSDENLPKGGSLDPKHAQKFLKRLRKILEPAKIRYFLVGEYGEKRKRPHFHVVLFGLDWATAGGVDGRAGVVQQAWSPEGKSLGHTYVDRCKPEAISYIAGYVTKKLTKEELDVRGLKREFTRMSLRPHGIGAAGAKDVAEAIRSVGVGRALQDGDVPTALAAGPKVLPIGRYLRGKLRKELAIGSPDANMAINKAPVEKTKAYWLEMWALRKKAQGDKKRKAKTFGQYLVDINAQKVLNLEARLKLTTESHTF